MKSLFSKEYSTEDIKGESRIRRSAFSMDELVARPSSDVNTVYDILTRSYKCYGSRKAFGFRRILQLHTKNKEVTKVIGGKEIKVQKDWMYYELSDFEYVTYEEFYEKVHNIGSGLRYMGLSKNDRISIYAATSLEWLTMAFSCISQTLTIVAAYDTLRDGVLPCFIETEIKGVFCDAALLSVIAVFVNSVTTLKLIVYSGKANENDLESFKEFKDLKVLSIEELECLGKNNLVEPEPPLPDDLICIMYTSGSTGIPKGVVMSHKNIVAAVSAISSVFGYYITDDDSVLCYLPLSHIYEFVFELFSFYSGLLIGYGTVKTLSDTNCLNSKGDIQTFKPTIITGVPAVWESVRKGIIEKLNSSSSIKQKLFWAAYRIKSRLLFHSVPGVGILNALVFKHIRAAMGGRLRVIFNGGSPISLETQKFLSTVLCPMLIGYGLTETCAICTIMAPSGFSLGTVGSLSVTLEAKLVDVPDAGYYTSSTPQQGEVWLRGTSISKGYFNRDEENKEAYTDDFWFKTGDIGEWTEDGQLRIIDRKKNLVKTLNGEYIALEKLESVYRSCNIISNICVYADPYHLKPVAIATPSDTLKKRLLDNKISFEDDISLICKNKEVRYFVLNQLLEIAKRNNFATIEYLENIILIDEEFSSQNGLLTAAQKFQRKKIYAKYKEEIDAAFQSLN
ncbi:hypothetical protein T552_01927 [Pneumocystis carinii B80]|uniref:AMP-dependent synthetase/ligase domain-containing protein n=1 Tax=Pneumocystis carinii (strain B80) TaxID=1408658 RepID=A0A0W4ZI91_PNEC8|nr:hypothetical protein T552_01927 [Pneumocystis carinii B80]KTW28065.1 hypothetical protein T552_01927 [Pneumocystis carinii B80]